LGLAVGEPLNDAVSSLGFRRKETEEDSDEDIDELSSSEEVFRYCTEESLVAVAVVAGFVLADFNMELITESRKALCSSTERAAKAANMLGFALSVRVDSAMIAVAALVGTSTASVANKRQPWASLIAARSCGDRLAVVEVVHSCRAHEAEICKGGSDLFVI